MKNYIEQTPNQQVFLGQFSAMKANLAYDAIANDRRDLMEVQGELYRMEQLVAEKGIISPEHDELIQAYKDYIEMVRKVLDLNRTEFNEACEEAGEYIGPGTLGERALFAISMDEKTQTNC